MTVAKSAGLWVWNVFPLLAGTHSPLIRFLNSSAMENLLIPNSGTGFRCDLSGYRTGCAGRKSGRDRILNRGSQETERSSGGPAPQGDFSAELTAQRPHHLHPERGRRLPIESRGQTTAIIFDSQFHAPGRHPAQRTANQTRAAIREGILQSI